ncbi:NPCBM/NEW2 domain-containing protein [Moorella naiadis]|uniref:NPCBM/NEW2 domain-containing protein n=1 Tax=Moorella naiadis (nom. illeg.) TaxID=3093670 RepID=UPI003D9CB45A
MKIGNYQLMRREQILITLAATVFILFFGYRIVWGRQIPAYRQLRARLQAEQTRLVTLRDQAAAAPELARRAEQARADWERTRLHLGFTLRGTAAFLTAAQPRNPELQVLAFRPLPPLKKGSFQVYPYEVTVSGPYPALVDYLTQLESLPAPVVIHKLKITSQPGPPVKVEADFSLDLYDLEAGAAVPAAVALFPTGRADSFAPPPGVSPAGPNSQPASGAVPGRTTGDGPGNVPAGPQSAAGGGDAGSGRPVPAAEGGGVALQPAPAEKQGTPPVAPSPGAVDTPPSYTLPRLVKGHLLPGPAFQEPSGPEAWLEELRVLRNVGPFYILDRPAALAGMSLGRSIGVNLNKGQNKAELKVDLHGRYALFQGYTGIDDSFANSSGKVIVTIFADGRQLYQGEIRPGDYPQYLELPLTLVQQLTFSLEWQVGGIGDYDQLLATLASIHFSRRD